MAASARAVYSKSGVFFPTPDGGSDALAYLIPEYIKDPKVALCPSTENYIRGDTYMTAGGTAGAVALYGSTNVLQDLTKAATDRGHWPGVSYEIFGWYSGNALFPAGVINPADEVRTVNEWLGLQPGDWGYNKANDTATTDSVPKRWGHLKGGSTTILALDSDQDPGNGTPGVNLNNWPDPHNNHGNVGGNIGFADAHVAFVPRGKQYIRTFLDSYGGMAQTTSITTGLFPGWLTISTGSAAKVNGHQYNAVYKVNGN